MRNTTAHLPPLYLPEGIVSSYVDCTDSCGLNFHILTAGSSHPSNPLLLFAHGFPELAYSWRKLLPRFASAGYCAVAMDQRGYGRTTGWDRRPYADVDLTQFRYTQIVRDLICLVHQLGRTHVDCIVGHDFGGVTAAMSALMRPDFFRACVIMSHPFDGVPTLPLGDPAAAVGTAYPKAPRDPTSDPDIQTSLAVLGRKHYKWANSTALAASQWENPPQGLTAFLRGYIYLKSARDPRNEPHPLSSWTAPELIKMPHYYIQKLTLSMPQTVAEDVLGHEAGVGATRSFLSADELAVYVDEWERTGFQGALNWYRSGTSTGNNRDLLLFAGKKIECPVVFISGEKDWGNCQKPGALEGMASACGDFRGVRLIPGAGHWPQQEQPDRVSEEIMEFLKVVC